MAVNSNEECLNVHGVVVLPDGGVANTQYELPAKLSSLEVPKFMKSQTCLNSEPILQSHTELEVDTVNSHAPCILDVDIEKGKAESTKFNEDCVANSKSGGSLAITLPREICLQIGGKLMQLLMNHGTELPKFTSRERFVAERVHDMTNNRSRKFKRSASFNSRRVVLLFSVFYTVQQDYQDMFAFFQRQKKKSRQSSMGTIILIYLTLRVRLQISDASGNI